MRDAGYQTHMIGKWHLGSYTQDLIPSQRGFDTFVGFLNDEETYWSHQVCVCVTQGEGWGRDRVGKGLVTTTTALTMKRVAAKSD